MTLQELKYKHVYYTLLKNDLVRSKTCKELGISLRSLRNYLNEMKAHGYELDLKEEDKKNPKGTPDYSVSPYVMPTNTQRLAYIDWLLNANFMKSVDTRLVNKE